MELRPLHGPAALHEQGGGDEGWPAYFWDFNDFKDYISYVYFFAYGVFGGFIGNVLNFYVAWFASFIVVPGARWASALSSAS